MGKRTMGVGGKVPKNVTLRVVPNTSEKYWAGTDGHIYCYSSAKTNVRKPRPFRVAEAIGSKGYPFVAIILAGQRRTRSVHTLVCLAYHGGKPSPVHETRHLDGVASNNRPTNLRWGTPAENEADKKRHGRTACGEKHGIAKLTDEAVRILRVAIPQGFWNPVDAAAVFNVDTSTIRRIVARKAWKHVK